MSEEEPNVKPGGEEEIIPLNYASPRLRRRYQKGPLWKAVVRVVGGMWVAVFFAGFIGQSFAVPGDAWVAILAGVAAAALIGLIAWERGMVLKEPIWEGAKDLRAQSYRASASRFDASGVTIVDPHSERGD